MTEDNQQTDGHSKEVAHANVLAAYEAWLDKECDFERALEDAGFQYDGKWWPDPYDTSCEFTKVDNDVRLTTAQQRIMFEAGFVVCYLNHKDGWESHYNWNWREPFKPVRAWRKRQTNREDGSLETIEVSELPKSWTDPLPTFGGRRTPVKITPDPVAYSLECEPVKDATAQDTTTASAASAPA